MQSIYVRLYFPLMTYALPALTSNIRFGEMEGHDLMNRDERCRDESISHENRILVGWPFQFSCQKLAENFGYSRENKELMKFDGYNGTCILQELRNGSEIWTGTIVPINWYKKNFINEVYNVTVQENDPIKFRVFFEMPAANYCTFEDYFVEKLPSNTTCDTVNKNLTVPTGAVTGRQKRLSCSVINSEFPKEYFQPADLQYITYEWTKNCSKITDKNIRRSGTDLIIQEVSFDNGGVYTCTVKYKGQKRYMVRHELCVKHKTSEIFSTKCPDVVKAEIGSDVTITCFADMGIGKTNEFLFISKWKKHDSIDGFDCKNYREGVESNSTLGTRSSCKIKSILEEEKCYMHRPPIEEQEPPVEAVQIILSFRNIQPSDLGMYNIMFGLLADQVQHNISLVFDPNPPLKRRATGIGVSISLLGVTVALFFLGLWWKYEILWLWKKYFGPYEADTHNYTAYLAYYYSNDIDKMSLESQQLTQNLLNGLYDALDSLGAITYDDNKDNQAKLQVENLAEIQKNCSRIIIVLNEEYVRDQWSMHKAYRAIQSTVEMGTKIIFITLAGFERSLINLGSESKATLNHAMKINITIPWCGKLPLSRKFRRRLEYALPKIKRNTNEHKLVTSSQTYLISHHDGHNL